MKVLVIGSGGREHAIAWKLSSCPSVKRVYIAPGNAGTRLNGENVAIPAEDISGLREFALREAIDLTVVGPELPLTLGIADEFNASGLRVFGPSKTAAEIEKSKSFAKSLMVKYRIPTAFYKSFDDHDEAAAYVDNHKPPFVVKADGLAAGKGVVICRTRDEAALALRQMMRDALYGSAGSRVVVEEFLEGQEASFLAVTDGKTVVPLAPAQDHKAIYDNDAGPNTGGMGAYSPTPLVTQGLQDEVMRTVMAPAVRAMALEGRPYLGVLYAGLMIKDGVVKVLEFNARFGDPETQPILMRMAGGDEFLNLLMASVDGRLDRFRPRWLDKAAVCVVMAAGGYPGAYAKGAVIRGLDDAARMEDVMVFHAGTAERDGNIVTAGGRVLGVTALGDGVEKAITRAYEAVGRITWDGAYYRRDIGRKAVGGPGN